MAETLLLLSARANAVDPILTDAQVAELSLHTDGRLRTNAKPAYGTSFRLTGAATINATVAKASPGSLLELSVFNPTGATVYLKLFNKATTPAPASDGATLLMAGIPVPTNSFVNFDFGFTGKYFPAGISFATTAAVAITDATVVAANVIVSGTYI